MIEVKNINKRFGDLQVLKDISFKVNKGEIVSIVGASGAGKTTLLQIIGTLDQADSGSIHINGQKIVKMSDSKLSAFRNENIGFIFQFHQLLPEFSALENIMLPGLIAKRKEVIVKEEAIQLLKVLGLEDRQSHKPSQLSGGEKQRVAVARALINKPAIILADEPSGSLDSENKEELQDLFFELRNQFNQTFIIVTHELSIASSSDRTIKMQDGRIIE